MKRCRPICRLGFLFVMMFSSAPAQPVAPSRLPGLQQPVTVIRDAYAIPHIYAKTLHDAWFMLGYLQAQDRLFEMDILRRRARGELAELLGPDYFEADLLMRQLGIRRTAEAAWRGAAFGGWIREALQAHADGVNAFVQQAGQAALAKMGPVPGWQFRPWTPVDAVAFVKYMGWDQSGTEDDLWLAKMAETFGERTVAELWPLQRPFEVPVVPEMHIRSSGPIPAGETGPLVPIHDEAYAAVHALFSRQPDLFKSDGAFGSNNWAVDGQKSTTGKPMLASDPHLGFQLPSLWYAAHLSAPGLQVTGVTFPGVPFVIIGHNADMAWGITNMQADVVDFFVETFDENNPARYRHRGAWKTVQVIRDTIRIAGAPPRPVQLVSTVHGPLLTRSGQRLALQWTGLAPTYETASLAQFNRARTLQDFKKALRQLGVPAINVAYADSAGNIAIAPHGNIPIRRRGLGRFPHPGASGDYDWIGLVPREELPLAVNPAQHFLASANQRPAPAGYPHYLGWMWDPSYRARRINALLRAKEKTSPADMQAIQYDHLSLPASIFVPLLLQAFDRQGTAAGSIGPYLQCLRDWDFRMAPDQAVPLLWTKWFEDFRDAVWHDEFVTRGVPEQGGSWGFTGNNRREPALEVLEYLCRYDPHSPWFDDRTTPAVESRDDIMIRSFQATLAYFAGQARTFGGLHPADWQWGRTHRLAIRSITGNAALDRTGIAIPGGRFTVNPGGGLFGTGGGASWRMVVDFADVRRSAGIYPGGQLADPGSPHYDDLLPLWVQGRYAPLHFVARAEDFPPAAIAAQMRYVPD